MYICLGVISADLNYDSHFHLIGSVIFTNLLLSISFRYLGNVASKNKLTEELNLMRYVLVFGSITNNGHTKNNLFLFDNI